MNKNNRILYYSVPARQDWQVWLITLAGLIFFIAAISVDPAINCDRGGECAPWIVYVASILGALFFISGITLMVFKETRGSYVDTQTNKFHWHHWSQKGIIDLNDVSKIEIREWSDSTDIHFHLKTNQRAKKVDNSVFPGQAKEWAESLIKFYPDIKLEIT